MKAVVFHDIGDIRLEDVAEPRLQEPTDAIVRLTASAICGTDLHFVRGSVGGMRPGTILGHEGVGIVEALGDEVRNLQVGDRVVIPRPSPAAIACIAEPATTPSATSPTPAAARPAPRSSAVPGQRRLPWAASRESADSLCQHRPDPPAQQHQRRPGDTPVGHLPHRLLRRRTGRYRPRQHRRRVRLRSGGPVRHRQRVALGAARVFAIDRHPDRLHMARQQGAEVIDFEREDPVRPCAG